MSSTHHKHNNYTTRFKLILLAMLYRHKCLERPRKALSKVAAEAAAEAAHHCLTGLKQLEMAY